MASPRDEHIVIPQRWTRIEALYHSALSLPPSDRETFLKASCGEDVQLFHEVNSLIEHSEDSFMQTPALQEALQLITKLQKEESERPILTNPEWTVEWSKTFFDTPRKTWSSAALNPILPGELLASRYRIIRAIGQGGMGQVFEAEDLKLRKKVALKSIRSEIAADPESLYRFKNEFRALTDVIHPSLVTLYDVFSDGEMWFFTMELVRGLNFVDYTKCDDSCRSRLRRALRQLVEAVLALHAAGKLHRDIKPPNVLVEDDDRLTLIDFGLVTEFISENLQHRLVLAGTPAYMSPEQALGQELREASDWYSVGTLLYEALTGELPFKGDYLTILRAKVSREPPPPSEIAAGVPEDLNNVARNLLRLDPASRPTGHELLRHVSAPAWSSGSSVTVPAHTLADVFVGRKKELEKLDQALQRIRAGVPVTVHLSGKSGIGKTALVRHFIKKVYREVSECVVLVGRCYERESVPFNAVDSLIDALSQYWGELAEPERKLLLARDTAALLRLFPVLGQVDVVARLEDRELIPDSRQLRSRAFAALRTIISHIGQRTALLLIIDDLQWADADSIALMKELFDGLEPLPVLFLLSYRDVADDVAIEPVLADIRNFGAPLTELYSLQLDVLAPEEASELASRLVSDRSQDRVLAEVIAKESGGMPFFVDALVRYSGSWNRENPERERENVPIRLDEFIQFVISGLPSEARTLLEVIAVAGEPLEMGVLRNATGVDVESRDAVPMLRMQSLIRILQSQKEPRIEVYHDRIREVVKTKIPSETQQHQYRRLASALESSGCSDSGRMAIYFHRGGDVARAGEYAVAAAEDAAEALAFDRAAQFYRLALQARDPDDMQNVELRSELANALVNAGKGAEAAAEYLSASELTQGVRTLVLKQKAAEQFLRSGHIDNGLALLYQLCKMTRVKLAKTSFGVLPALMLRRMQLWFRGLHFDERSADEVNALEVVRVDLCWALGIGWSVVDTIRGSEAQTLFLLLALKAGEPYRISLGLSGEAAYSAFRRRPRRADELLPKAQALAQQVGKPHAVGLAIFCQGMRDWVAGNWEKTVSACRQAQEIWSEKCTGTTWEIDIARIFELASLAWMGRWREHSKRLPSFRKEADHRGDLFAIVSLPLLTYSYMMLLGQDDVDGSRQEIRDLIGRWSKEGYHVQHFWAMHGEVETALYCDDADLAYERLNHDWRALKRSLQLRLPLGAVFAYYLRARTRLEKARATAWKSFGHELWLREAEEDAKRIERRRMICSNPIALLIRAGINAQRRERESAADSLARAEVEFKKASMMIHAAVARRRRGELTASDELVSSANSLMAGEGIVRPDRIARMMAPGF